MMKQMDHPWECFYSVVRYVADSFRDEPKNIGVIVLCPEQTFQGAKFRLDNLGLPSTAPRYKFIASMLAQYSKELPGDLPSLASAHWHREQLDELAHNHSDLIQFTPPVPALGEPGILLKELYRSRVQPRQSPDAERRSRAVRLTASALRRALTPTGKSSWVHVKRSGARDGGLYPFDITVSNGQLYFAIETLSFQVAHPQLTEQRGGWYAQRWPEVLQSNQLAQGILLYEPPTKPAAQEYYHRVLHWMEAAKVRARPLSDLPAVASEVATALAS